MVQLALLWMVLVPTQDRQHMILGLPMFFSPPAATYTLFFSRDFDKLKIDARFPCVMRGFGIDPVGGYMAQ